MESEFDPRHRDESVKVLNEFRDFHIKKATEYLENLKPKFAAAIGKPYDVEFLLSQLEFVFSKDDGYGPYWHRIWGECKDLGLYYTAPNICIEIRKYRMMQFLELLDSDRTLSEGIVLKETARIWNKVNSAYTHYENVRELQRENDKLMADFTTLELRLIRSQAVDPFIDQQGFVKWWNKKHKEVHGFSAELIVNACKKAAAGPWRGRHSRFVKYLSGQLASSVLKEEPEKPNQVYKMVTAKASAAITNGLLKLNFGLSDPNAKK